MRFTHLNKTIWLGIASSAMIACSNGGSTGAAQPKLPENLSLVTAKDSSASASLTMGALTSSTFAADSDYMTDKTNSYVYDTAMEPLQTANMILCLMNQTGADKMTNSGAYYALVDEDKCEQGSNNSGAGSTGQSSGGKAIKYNRWTVESTSDVDSNSAMRVKLWIPGDEASSDPHEKEKVVVEVVVSEGVSANKPFGSFVLNFKGITDYAGFGGSTGNYVETMKGSLRTIDNEDGKPQFSLINLGGKSVNSNADYRFEQYTNAILDDSSGTGGIAKTRSVQQWQTNPVEDTSYAINFNSTLMNRGTDSNGDSLADAEACMTRSSFNTQVWRYNLYHRDAGTYAGKSVTAGQRAALNSGFPFTYDNGSKTFQGHVGYWGIWVENDATVPSGAAIKKVDYSSGTTTDYTVKISNGKLIRRTKNSLAITKLVGQDLMFWGQNPNDNKFDQYIVRVDPTTYNFKITHKFSWGTSGPELTDITDADITPSVTGTSLWLWADALGGNVVYTHDTATTAASRLVKFYGDEVVNPGDSAISAGLTLTCYHQCLKGGVSSLSGLTNDSTLYYTADGTAYTYTLSVSGGVLTMKDNTANANVDFTGFSTTDMKNIQHEWGINTGSMVTNPGSLANWYEIYDAAVSYRWETGTNNWNRLVAVIDASNNVQSFDKPIQFVYQLTAGDELNGDPNGKAGNTFMLQYGGSGNLWGFPWMQSGNRWYTSVNLKTGVELTDADGRVFIVKATEQEQTFKAATGQCSALDTNSVFSNSSLSLPTEATMGTVNFGWTDMPTPENEAPAFIGGEKQ